MRGRPALGVHGYPLPRVDRVQDRDLVPLHGKGIMTLSLYMSAAHRDDPGRWATRLVDRLAAQSMRLFCLVGPAGRLLADDETERRLAVKDVAHGLDAVRAAGAERLFLQPGGHHPDGPWWFHPRNFAAAARAAVTRSISDLARRAEDLGVGI